MNDTTITKVQSVHSPRGPHGEKYLASGVRVAMRMWEREPKSEPKTDSRRDYETVGYVIAGRARLHTEGQVVSLDPGDCWVVPKGALHHYEVLSTFTALEATSPPFAVHGRDEPQA